VEQLRYSQVTRTESSRRGYAAYLELPSARRASAASATARSSGDRGIGEGDGRLFDPAYLPPVNENIMELLVMIRRAQEGVGGPYKRRRPILRLRQAGQEGGAEGAHLGASWARPYRVAGATRILAMTST